MNNIENALKIVQGGTEVPELLWLADQAYERGSIVEIGCWTGRSTTALADNTDGVVFCVDSWRINEKRPEWPYDEFCRNLWPYIDNGKVISSPVLGCCKAVYRCGL